MVPSGWRKVVLNDVSERVAVGLATSVTEAYTDVGIPIIRNLNIKKGYFDDSKMLYLSEEFSSKHPNKRVKAGDVITVHTGSNVGLTCVVPEEYNLAQTFTTLIVTPKAKDLDSWFLNYVLNSDYGEYQALRLVVGGGKGNLNTSDFKIYPLLLPPLSEQRKIAKILSTWDKAISTTERLIDNSKQQKKALMQQLLTGKKRLLDDSGKTFESEWDYVRAGNIFLTRSNKKHDSDLPILAITQDQGAIPREFIDYNVSVTKESISGYKVVEQGDFIISLRSFQGGIEYSRYKGICSPAYVILYPKIKIVDAFYKYHLKSHIFIQAMKSRLEGIRDGKIISYKYFSEIKLPKPSLEEQQKIASVLTNADKEIELLEQQLADLKQEKKALMQQLLTGKRRVKVDDKEAA
ncbi:restriction endonuclease subunit S [Marinomonas sp. 5E14-1]|uniref:restriction endonuclease subunit S n=1 Tax=Marinomonas sp. 5E14-1 TaxID=3153922 RepID=UPI00326389EA